MLLSIMLLGPGEPAAGPWRVVAVSEFARHVLAFTGDPADRPRLVAVDGRQGGGKTTLADRLSTAVGQAPVVHTDDVAWFHGFFSWAPLMIEGILRPLHAGHAVSYRPPAWSERGRDGSIEVGAGSPLVVIEGVGAARRELMPFLDAVIWVQSDLNEADRRGIVRDGGSQQARDFWYEWAAAEIPFLADQRPWERADLVVAGTPPVPHGAHEVVVAPALGSDGFLEALLPSRGPPGR
jgi:hypothetical protein